MDSSKPIVHKRSSNLKLSECGKYEENPFLEKAIRAVEGGVVKKYKSSSSYDQRAVLQAVDPKTGEVLGHTSFIRQVEVDEADIHPRLKSRGSQSTTASPVLQVDQSSG